MIDVPCCFHGGIVEFVVFSIVCLTVVGCELECVIYDCVVVVIDDCSVDWEVVIVIFICSVSGYVCICFSFNYTVVIDYNIV